MASASSSPPSPTKRHVVIGSRKSDLAMWQAREVKRLLEALPGASERFSFEIQTEISQGDKILDVHLASLAAAQPGIFTKELELGLQSRAYDLAVHSLKDMPTRLPAGLVLAGITAREDPRDALLVSARHYSAEEVTEGDGAPVPPLDVSRCRYRSLGALPPGSVVGTSSLRREAMIRKLFPHLTVATVRGNLNTRLRKLDGTFEEGGGVVVAPPTAAHGAALPQSAQPTGTQPSSPPPASSSLSSPSLSSASASSSCGGGGGASGSTSPSSPVAYDALVMAAAGMKRMGWGGRIVSFLPPADQPYAVGQGALGIETRTDDPEAVALARAISHVPSVGQCAAERAYLNRLQGGCQVPIAVSSVWDWQGQNWWEAVHAQQEQGGEGASGDAVDALQLYPSVATLTLTGTVTSIDGSSEVQACGSEVFLLPGGSRSNPLSRVTRRGVAPVGGTAGEDAVPAAEPPSPSSAASSSDKNDFPWCAHLTWHQWEALTATATALGAAVARKSVSAGANAILGPLTAPRPTTYGAAEQPVDR